MISQLDHIRALLELFMTELQLDLMTFTVSKTGRGLGGLEFEWVKACKHLGCIPLLSQLRF